MTVRIRYMGNKHALGARLASLIAAEPPDRPLLDLFCGMCSLGAAIAPSGRSVWGNDIQAYAALAARCQTTSTEPPLASRAMAIRLEKSYLRNAHTLK